MKNCGCKKPICYTYSFNLALKNPLIGIPLALIAFSVGTIDITYQYFLSQFSKFFNLNNYQPFALSSEVAKNLYNINETKVSGKFIADGKANYFIEMSQETDNFFWSKQLSYVVLGEKKDQIFYSLCTSKIINGKTSVIENFDLENDKINFFCTKKEITLEDININHKIFQGEDFTCVEVQGIESLTVTCLKGNIPLEALDIQITDIGAVNQIFYENIN